MKVARVMQTPIVFSFGIRSTCFIKTVRGPRVLLYEYQARFFEQTRRAHLHQSVHVRNIYSSKFQPL
jgi:hypothetical protein